MQLMSKYIFYNQVKSQQSFNDIDAWVNKLKEKAIQLMTSKEMLDNARKKDKENYDKAKNGEKE